MGSPTNLTVRIAQLREKKNVSSILNNNLNERPNPELKPLSIKRLAYDYFNTFSYILLIMALIGQLLLIVSLDLF